MPKPSGKRQRASAASGSTRTVPATRRRSTSKSSDVVVNSSSNRQKSLPQVCKTSSAGGAIRVTVMLADSTSTKALDDEPCEVQMLEPAAASELTHDPNDEQASELDTRASAKRRRTSADIKSGAGATSGAAQEAVRAPDSATVADSELPDRDDAPGDSGALEPTAALEESVSPPVVAPESPIEPSVEEQQAQSSDELIDETSRSPDAPSAVAVDGEGREHDEVPALAPHEPNDVDMAEADGESQAQPAQERADTNEPVGQDADAEVRCNTTLPEPLGTSVQAHVLESEPIETVDATKAVHDGLKAPDESADDAAVAAAMDTDDKESDCNGAQSCLETPKEAEPIDQSPLHEVPDGDATTLDTPEQLHQDASPCHDPLLKTTSVEPSLDAPTAQAPQQSSLPVQRKSKTATAAAKKKRSAASSVSLASTRHLFQFTCKLLQSQRLELEVRAREVEEKRAVLAATREKWEKRIRSVKRQLRDFGHPVDEVEAAAASSASSSNGSSSANGASSRAFARAAAAAPSESDPLALTASGDWNSTLAGDAAPTSLITMRDAFSTRQLSSAATATATSGTNGVDSHFPASIQALETQIRDSLASRKRMVQDMVQDLEGGRRLSGVTTARPR